MLLTQKTQNKYRYQSGGSIIWGTQFYPPCHFSILRELASFLGVTTAPCHILIPAHRKEKEGRKHLTQHMSPGLRPMDRALLAEFGSRLNDR